MKDWSTVTDPVRLQRVSLALRVRALGPGDADKYAWVRVQVVAVIKNTSGQEIEPALDIAYYSGKAGVPAGESTIYLEPYSDAPKHPWKLLGGSADLGVSHPDGGTTK